MYEAGEGRGDETEMKNFVNHRETQFWEPEYASMQKKKNEIKMMKIQKYCTAGA